MTFLAVVGGIVITLLLLWGTFAWFGLLFMGVIESGWESLFWEWGTAVIVIIGSLAFIPLWFTWFLLIGSHIVIGFA